MTQATRSAGQSGIGYKRARDIAAPAHLGALIAAKPRIQAMIQDGVTASLLPKQPLETIKGFQGHRVAGPTVAAGLLSSPEEPTRCMLELFSSKIPVDQDLSVIVAETFNDDDVKQRLVPIVFTRGEKGSHTS